MNTSRMNVRGAVTLMLACGIGAGAGLSSMVVGAASDTDSATRPPAAPTQESVPNEPGREPGSRRHLDRSGRRQVGKASFYADTYAGKKMADGTPMRLYSNNAASDRGPYVKGRIIDLSPVTAHLIGIRRRQGIALVEVIPISFPAGRS
jgi:rare lipoprotein A